MTANVDFVFRDRAFNQRMLTFAIVNREHIDVRQFLREACEYYENEIRSLLQVLVSVKVSTCFVATFEKTIIDHASGDSADGDDDENRGVVKKEVQDLYIHTNNTIVEKDTNLGELFEESVLNVVLRKIDDAIMQGSGFSLSAIKELTVQVNRYDPIRGSSYIKTPKFLADKRAIVNVKNKDNKCFMWAVLSALHHDKQSKNHDRLKKYEKYDNELNFKGIEFPIQIKSIGKFEQLNEALAINVYMYDTSTKKIQPLRISKEMNRKRIHLMLLKKETDNVGETEPKSHYCWISNLSRLISTQVTKHRGKTHFCDRCLNYFWSHDKLEKHIAYCVNQNELQIEMPTPGKDTIEFKNYKKQVVCPL